MHHSMRYKLTRTVAFGGIMVLGLSSAQAAMASPAQPSFTVPCWTPALYDALANASDGETIILAPTCTYWLDSALPNVNTDLTILGNGATLRRGNNADSFTILSVTSDVNVSISSLSFVNGGGPENGDGGALYNDGGNVSINGGVFRDNVGGEYGGAIENNSGTLTVKSATFADNVNYYEYGGAITNFADATIISSLFTGNRSEYDSNEGYGGAIENEGTSLRVSFSTFIGNSTNGYGGAIYTDEPATLVNDNLRGNSAYQGGGIYNDGTLTVTTSSITGNTASDSGGGIYNDGGTVYLTGDYIHGNQPNNCTPFISGCND
jgi:predicted outer membrane repeat protein